MKAGILLRQYRRVFGFLLLLFCLDASWVHASGFYTPDIGAKTVGRGGAWIVGVNDLTALYLNPAGLAHVRGVNLMVVNNYDIFHTAYRREPYGPVEHNRNPVDVIQFAALSSNFHLKDFTFAIGVYGPYSVSEEYDPKGPQRYEVVEIQRVQLYYMIGVGWRPFDWFRIGAEAGVGEFSERDVYCFSAFKDSQMQNDILADVYLEQVGNMMYGAGVQFGPFKGFEMGFSYQPQTDLELSGHLEADLPPLFQAFLGKKVYTDKLKVTTKFPPIARMGIRQRITGRFDLEADAVWIGWHRYKKQDIDFERGTLVDDYTVPIDWNDTWNYRLGGDYELFNNFTVRAGGWYDRSATPLHRVKPGAIEADRWSAAGGIGYFWKGITLDAAYSHIWMQDSEVRAQDMKEPELGDPRGEYKGNYDMILLGMNLNFGKIASEFKGGKRD